ARPGDRAARGAARRTARRRRGQSGGARRYALSTELDPRRRARQAGAPERAHRVGAARARARDGGAPVTRRRARGTSLVELLVGTVLALLVFSALTAAVGTGDRLRLPLPRPGGGADGDPGGRPRCGRPRAHRRGRARPRAAAERARRARRAQHPDRAPDGAMTRGSTALPAALATLAVSAALGA